MDGVSKCPVMHGAVTSNNSERTTNKMVAKSVKD
jgi:hypothetical protein